MNTPQSNDEAGLSEQLRRDARRISAAPFDRTLHEDGIRRIRALSAAKAPGLRWWIPSLSGFAAALLVLAFRNPVAPPQPHTTHLEPVSVAASGPATAWVYSQLAAQGGDVLLDRLAEDARFLLPATSRVFSVQTN